MRRRIRRRSGYGRRSGRRGRRTRFSQGLDRKNGSGGERVHGGERGNADWREGREGARVVRRANKVAVGRAGTKWSGKVM